MLLTDPQERRTINERHHGSHAAHVRQRRQLPNEQPPSPWPCPCRGDAAIAAAVGIKASSRRRPGGRPVVQPVRLDEAVAVSPAMAALPAEKVSSATLGSRLPKCRRPTYPSHFGQCPDATRSAPGTCSRCTAKREPCSAPVCCGPLGVAACINKGCVGKAEPRTTGAS